MWGGLAQPSQALLKSFFLIFKAGPLTLYLIEPSLHTQRALSSPLLPVRLPALSLHLIEPPLLPPACASKFRLSAARRGTPVGSGGARPVPLRHAAGQRLWIHPETLLPAALPCAHPSCHPCSHSTRPHSLSPLPTTPSQAPSPAAHYPAPWRRRSSPLSRCVQLQISAPCRFALLQAGDEARSARRDPWLARRRKLRRAGAQLLAAA